MLRVMATMQGMPLPNKSPMDNGASTSFRGSWKNELNEFPSNA